MSTALSSLRKSNHSAFSMHAHLIFVTKYRKKILTKKMLDTLEACLKKVCIDFNSHLKEFDGEQDHVHLLIEYTPKLAVARLVNALKGVSSRALRIAFPSIRKVYWK